MNVADGSRSQGEVQARQAALVIRGVGDAVPNEAVSQLAPVLEHYDISPAREVNWSWTELIEWPYAEGSPAAEKGDRSAIPRSRFLRHLGFSVFGTSDRNLAALTRWSRTLVPLISILLLPSKLFAAVLASLPILLVLHVVHLRVALLACLLLCLPLIMSLFSFDWALVQSTFRALLLRVLWPLAFPVLVAFSFGWIPPVYLAVTLAGAIGLSSLVPGHLRYVPSSTLKSDIFENSIWLTAVQWLGSYLGSCLASWAIIAGLSRLGPGLSFILKVLADVARYLGDPVYRDRVQQEVEKEVSTIVESGAKELFIFAHSLGTVIAVDYLRGTQRGRFRTIRLVTCGSPLRRLFWRFFANDYSEPSETFRHLSRTLSELGVEFDWFNVYRRKDPIGGSLELSEGRDEPVSREHETFGNAHLGYWNDTNAQETVISMLSNSTKAVRSSAQQSAANPPAIMEGERQA